VNDDVRRQNNHIVWKACEDAYERKAERLAEEEKHGPRPVSRVKALATPLREQFA